MFAVSRGLMGPFWGPRENFRKSGPQLMALTDTAIRAAKPGDKPIKLFDEKGLFLLLQPSGGKLWRFSHYIAEAKRIARHNMEPLVAKREALKVQHQAERQAFDKFITARGNEEQRIRSSRLRKGIAGAWDFLTGKYFKVRKQNEMEARFARERDSQERHALIRAQHKDRQALQELIKENRRKEAERILGLYRDAAKFRRMREGEAERDKDRGRSSTTMRPKRDRGLDLG
jgi:hypothetical protein